MNRLQTLEPEFAAVMAKILQETSDATGLNWIPISCRRTMSEQDALYAQGRTTKGNKVTNAPAGSSPHNFGLACDAAPLCKGNDHEVWWGAPAGFWEAYGAICKANGMVWGGGFRSLVDNPHCEHPSWKEQQALWKAGKLSVA